MSRKIISLFTAAILSSSAVYAEYIDVTPDAWYSEYVSAASSAGWFSGYDDGTFLPEGTITRAEAMKVLLTYKSLDLANTEENAYTDVDSGAWYADYVNSNISLGIIPSDKDKFRPEEKITREDAMYGLIKVIGLNTSDSDTSILDSFSDSSKIGENKKASVAAAVSEKIVGGYEDGTINPEGSITRAEFAAIMLRADEKKAEKPSPTVAASPSASPKASEAPKNTPSPTPINQKDGENLFNYKYTSGKVTDTANGSEKDNAQYITSDYISVAPGVNYFCASFSPSSLSYTDTCTAYSYYDADKNFISGGTKSMKTPTAAPENAAYIKFSVKQTAELTDYDRLARYTVFAKSPSALTEFTYPSSEKTIDKFDGKKVYIYGDISIKNGSGWLNILEKNTGVQFNEVYTGYYFGANNTNSLCANSHINQIPGDADYIFIYGGMYDWITSITIGEINSRIDTTTLYGVSLLNKRLKERYKNSEIIYITPYTVAAFGLSSFSANGLTNALGFTISDYADSIKEQAEADGLKVIDLNKNVEIHANNIDEYIRKDGNNQLYPNNDGAKIIGEYLLNEITK